MGYQYVVFGAGRQGTCAINDLIQNCEAESILVIDRMRMPFPRPATGWAPCWQRMPISTCPMPQSDGGGSSGAAVVLSCAPYRFNAELTRLSLKSGAFPSAISVAIRTS